jgi:hypothetical protein
MSRTERPVTEIIDAGTAVSTEVGSMESMVLMVDELPEPDDDATERILAQLLRAKSTADLNKPWEAAGIQGYLDVPLRVLKVTRAPSDFEDGIGVYVVIHAVNVRTNEPVIATTGSVSILAQLIMAHRNGWLPATVIPRGPKRKPRNGRFPMHLEFPDAVSAS